MPATVDDYTHRIGRTGRADEVGEAFTFVVHHDMLMVRNIEKALGKKIEQRKLSDFNYDAAPPKRGGPRRRKSAETQHHPKQRRFLRQKKKKKKVKGRARKRAEKKG